MSSENRDKEFYQLSTQALHCLEQPQEASPSDVVRQLKTLYRLWHYPAFGVYKSWLILLPYNEKDSEITLARQVCWNRPSDYERLSNPLVGIKKGFNTDPTIDVADAAVQLDDLYQQLTPLRNIRTPIGGFPDSIGVDGERFGFETFSFIGRARIEWWCEGPPEWKEFIKWFADMREFLESHFRVWE